MDVKGIQQNFAQGLTGLETGVSMLTGMDPTQAGAEIEFSQRVITDTMNRLSKVQSEMALVNSQIMETSMNQQRQTQNQTINNLTETQNEIGALSMATNKKEITAFNLSKQSQAFNDPFAEDFNGSAGFEEEPFPAEQDFGGEQFPMEGEIGGAGAEAEGLNRQSFTDFFKGIAGNPQELFDFVKQNTPPETMEINDKLTEQFNMIVDDPMKMDEIDQIAGLIYDNLDDNVKAVSENTEMGIPSVVSETNEIIKKLAKEHVASKKVKSFNLTKTAQHKTVENVILHGPNEKRFDPFLRQPVSDWSVIERNKGFGLTFDDVWDVDYEAIWRGAVMDKYSRPYRDKEGNWVGGYINKRFEVDHNIPETNNYQLKPGELRKPILPEYGNTESRLQAARAAGEIEGAPDMNTDKPFNWKEASSKKKS